MTLKYRDELWWARQRKVSDEAASEASAARWTAGAAQAGPSGADLVLKPDPDHAKPSQRATGETGRAPDGKRRKLAVASRVDEVIELSD